MKSSPVFRIKETENVLLFFSVRSSFSSLLNTKCGIVTRGITTRENTASSKQKKPFKGFYTYLIQ